MVYIKKIGSIPNGPGVSAWAKLMRKGSDEPSELGLILPFFSPRCFSQVVARCQWKAPPYRLSDAKTAFYF